MGSKLTGIAACPPFPAIKTSNVSAAANKGPGADAIVPDGSLERKSI